MTQIPPHYLSVPRSGRGRGVLVLHSWWGLNGFFKGLCDRLAKAGFVALAPDLYDGEVATTIEAARALRAAATASRRVPAYKMLIGAIEHLAHHDAVASPQLAVLGFSMGGHWALWLAQRPELAISQTVVFYAARSGDFSQSHSRFLLHFAETDAWVSASSVKKLQRGLQAAGKEVTSHCYPGTGHWFFEQDRPEAFQAAAAALAWRRSLEFLR